MPNKKYAVGVDLGGTNIVFAVLDAKGRIHYKIKVCTLAHEGKDAVIQRIVDGVRRVLEESGVPQSQVQGVGVGSPGPLSATKGVIFFAPNLPGFKNVPIRDILKKRLKMPVLLENDANAACFGEFWAGAGRGLKHLVMLTLGTGVGGGIILWGKLYAGVDDTAGELGHMVVDPSGPACNCGQRGCLEQFGSATAIARRARELAAKNPRGLLMKLAGGRAANISSRLVHEAALKGDPVAKQVMAETTRYLGIGVANLINIFNPQMVVLGGGVMGAGQTFLKAIEREARARAFETPAKTAKIVAAKLGDDMGVVGAAGLVFARG